MKDLTEYLKLDDLDTIAPQDVRPGDKVLRISTATLYLEDPGVFAVEFTVKELIGIEWARGESGCNFHISREDDTLYLIDRPKPKLPIEPGSVIIATEVRGIKGEWPMILDHDASWFSGLRIDGAIYHLPDDITAWRPASITVDSHD